MNNKIGNRYTREFKDMVVTRMMPPNNEAIKKLSEEFGVSEQLKSG